MKNKLQFITRIDWILLIALIPSSIYILYLLVSDMLAGTKNNGYIFASMLALALAILGTHFIILNPLEKKYSEEYSEES